MVTVCICGSRNFTDEEFIYSKLDEYLNTVDDDYVVIEGGADGADEIARKYCDEKGISHTSFKADWKTFGKSAGPIRNKYMAEECDIVIAFRLKNKKNKGTDNMINQAKKFGKKIIIFDK